MKNFKSPISIKTALECYSQNVADEWKYPFYNCQYHTVFRIDHDYFLYTSLCGLKNITKDEFEKL